MSRFGRIVDQQWYDYGASADAERVKHGYDRDSSRTYRENTVAASSHDQLYAYDNLNRLTSFDKGDLNGTYDGMSALASAQRWTLDPTGNWSEWKEDTNGDTDYTDAADLDQDRTHNRVNEVTDVSESAGQTAWASPTQDLAGNLTAFPKPAAPATSLSAKYDAWNRLVEVKEGANLVGSYVYDGRGRRIAKKTYAGGSVDQTRQFFYSDAWQVLEERVDERSNDIERQYVWGIRYTDELVLRDRDAGDDSTLEERFYALQDANYNLTGIVDIAGDVQERYSYTPYGVRTIHDGTFGSRASSSYAWTMGHHGLAQDGESGLAYNRSRMLSPMLGRYVQREPGGYLDGMNLYQYVRSMPTTYVDPTGWQATQPPPSTSQATCTIELWCWPAFGGVVGDKVHCEYSISGSSGANGRCRGEMKTCPDPLRFCWCEGMCVGATWQPTPPAMPPGAFLAASVTVPESTCGCLRQNCQNYPRTHCYAGLPLGVRGHGNSNTVASCLNNRCSLGLPPPGNAPGWGGDCPWRLHNKRRGTKVLKRRRTLRLIGAVLGGLAVYYGTTAILVYVVLEVLQLSVSTADLTSLAVIVIVRLVPLICAILTAVFVMHSSREKPIGFEVRPTDKAR